MLLKKMPKISRSFETVDSFISTWPPTEHRSHCTAFLRKIFRHWHFPEINLHACRPNLIRVVFGSGSVVCNKSFSHFIWPSTSSPCPGLSIHPDPLLEPTCQLWHSCDSSTLSTLSHPVSHPSVTREIYDRRWTCSEADLLLRCLLPYYTHLYTSAWYKSAAILQQKRSNSLLNQHF